MCLACLMNSRETTMATMVRVTRRVEANEVRDEAKS
jgi:hypothetical protein